MKNLNFRIFEVNIKDEKLAVSNFNLFDVAAVWLVDTGEIIELEV